MTPKSLFFLIKPFAVILIIGAIVIAESCKKEDPIEPPVVDNKEVIDSGQYNANHYLPMKFGAYWEYLHDNGTLEKVSCSEMIHHEYYDKFTNSNYVYDAHQLTSDYPNAGLPDIEPILHGTMVADEWTIDRPYYDFCSKSSYLRHRLIFDNAFGQLRYQPIYVCSTLPIPAHFVVCLDSSVSVDSFPEVAVMLYAPLTTFDSSINRDMGIDIDPFKLLEPLVLEGNAAYSISWFARGVGLIRRDIYANQLLVDRMRLVRYHFP